MEWVFVVTGKFPACRLNDSSFFEKSMYHNMSEAQKYHTKLSAQTQWKDNSQNTCMTKRYKGNELNIFIVVHVYYLYGMIFFYMYMNDA